MTNERKNITQPSDWWAAFEEAAKAEGLTLAAWLGEAAKGGEEADGTTASKPATEGERLDTGNNLLNVIQVGYVIAGYDDSRSLCQGKWFM